MAKTRTLQEHYSGAKRDDASNGADMFDHTDDETKPAFGLWLLKQRDPGD